MDEIVDTDPSIHLALVPPSDLIDVVGDDLGESVPVVDIVDPPRKLGVPHESVSSNQLPTAGGPVRHSISVTPIELSAVGYKTR